MELVESSSERVAGIDPWISWLNEEVYRRLQRRAIRHFHGDEVLGEEAFNYALAQLAENDWYRLRCFRGQSSKSTFLNVVFGRLLEDFRHKRFGRTRPPAVVSHLFGALGREIFELLYLRKWNARMVIDHLSAREANDAEVIAQAVNTINKLGCRSIGPVSLDGGERVSLDRLADTVASCSVPDRVIQNMLFEQYTLLLRVALVDELEMADVERLGGPGLDWRALKEKLYLDDSERCLLEMRYLEGRSFGFIARFQARMSGSGSRIYIRSLETRLRRQHDRILKRWRHALEQEGVSAVWLSPEC